MQQLDEKMTFEYNDPRANKPNKRKKKRRFNTAAFLLGVLALIAAVGAVYFAMSLRTANEALAEQTAETQRLTEELHDYTPKMTDDALIPFSTIRGYTDEAQSLTDFISRFYPDCMVYTDIYNEIIYQPVDPSIARNTYDWELLKRDEKLGRDLMSYTTKDGAAALKVIDVSEFQGKIDWKKVKADGVAFAFIRAGLRGYESSTVFEDERFEQNLKGANEAGLPVGAYFYSQAATVEEAVEEAQFVLEKIEGYEVSCPIVLDMEEENSAGSRTRDLTPTQRTDIAIAFMDTISAAGHKPMIYGNMRMFAQRLDLTRLVGYEKWFAQYFSRPYYPYEFGIWQYSCEGTVEGISGDVDMNLAFVDYSK